MVFHEMRMISALFCACRGPEPEVVIREKEVASRIHGTTQWPIQIGLLRNGFVIVGICLAVANSALHFWLHLPSVTSPERL